MGNRDRLRQNVGPVDRVIRAAIGAALVAWPVWARWGPWTVAILAAIGGMQIHTAIVGY